MGHGHAHHVTGRKLGVAFSLTFLILLVLLVGGWFSHSLALWADAGHVVTDIAALGLSWYATVQAGRPASAKRTFGYHRTGILAATANAVALILIALYIAWEAYQRFFHLQAVHSNIMIASAAVGMGLNLFIGFGLKDESHDNLNVRSAFLHVMGDAAASGGVIVGAIVIALTGWQIVDPVLSVAIALFIAYGAWQVLEESVAILMEGVPKNLDLAALVRDIRSIEGIRDLHDLHVWSIASGIPSLSCHLVIDDQHVSSSMSIIGHCNTLLHERYHISHTTIQTEAEHCSPDAPDCNLALVQAAHHHDHEHHDHDHEHHHH